MNNFTTIWTINVKSLFFFYLIQGQNSYSLRPKLYAALGKRNCLKLYVALQYQCNINVIFPIITLTIYYNTNATLMLFFLICVKFPKRHTIWNEVNIIHTKDKTQLETKNLKRGTHLPFLIVIFQFHSFKFLVFSLYINFPCQALASCNFQFPTSASALNDSNIHDQNSNTCMQPI